MSPSRKKSSGRVAAAPAASARAESMVAPASGPAVTAAARPRRRATSRPSDQALTVLRDRFGHDDFRGGQWEPVDAVLHGQDALVVMPTGSGKSLVYQLPALMLPGLTVVVSPLIALMKDQHDKLLA